MSPIFMIILLGCACTVPALVPLQQWMSLRTLRQAAEPVEGKITRMVTEKEDKKKITWYYSRYMQGQRVVVEKTFETQDAIRRSDKVRVWFIPADPQRSFVTEELDAVRTKFFRRLMIGGIFFLLILIVVLSQIR